MAMRNDWCGTCEEISSYHAAICSVCGETLSARPLVPRLTRGDASARDSYVSTSQVDRIQQQYNLFYQQFRGSMNELSQQESDLQGVLPAEAFDPQQARPISRGTAKETLKNLPRVKLEETSSILAQATVSICNGGPTFQAVAGEFGPPAPHSFKNKLLVLASPKTGKGGLSPKTISTAEGSILFMERGDDLTFVQKAIIAQKVGAVAVIIGNNTNASWPYLMRDSTGEAISLSLRIPVVMLKQDDGKLLARHSTADPCKKCDLEIQPISRECVICCETFVLAQTLLRIPACGHMFHEVCALTWLTQHNSCPYCRRELATDDVVYEAERQRTQRTHGGSNVNTTDSNGDSFYG